MMNTEETRAKKTKYIFGKKEVWLTKFEAEKLNFSLAFNNAEKRYIEVKENTDECKE